MAECGRCTHRLCKLAHKGVAIHGSCIGVHVDATYFKVVFPIEFEIVFSKCKFKKLNQRVIAGFDSRVQSELTQPSLSAWSLALESLYRVNSHQQ